VHITSFQCTEHNRCLVPYVLVLHIQSVVLIDSLPSGKVNGSVYDVSIREPDLDWVIIVLDGDDFNRDFLVGEPNISSFMKYDLECEWPF